MVSMTKRVFWSIFWPAWKQTFTLKNIESEFKKTGIFPYNPSLILDKITKKPKTETSTTPETLMSCRAVRRVYRIYKFKPILEILSQILRANERLTAELAIDQYVIRELINSL